MVKHSIALTQERENTEWEHHDEMELRVEKSLRQ